MLNSVVEISVMFAKYFEYYTIALRGGAFFRGHTFYARLCVRVSVCPWADLQSFQSFVAKTTYTYTANAYSVEREMSASACSRCMPGLYVCCVSKDVSMAIMRNGVVIYLRFAAIVLT